MRHFLLASAAGEQGEFCALGNKHFWEQEGCLATVEFSSVLPEAWRGETPVPKLTARP